VNGVIMGLGVLVCLYPAIKAAKITPVEAMSRV
jgi:ABC-type antimicrobial peptide transport system permease subunit